MTRIKPKCTRSARPPRSPPAGRSVTVYLPRAAGEPAQRRPEPPSAPAPGSAELGGAQARARRAAYRSCSVKEPAQPSSAPQVRVAAPGPWCSPRTAAAKPSDAKPLALHGDGVASKSPRFQTRRSGPPAAAAFSRLPGPAPPQL